MASAPTARPASVSSDVGKETLTMSRYAPTNVFPSPRRSPALPPPPPPTTHLRCSSLHDDSLSPAIRMAAVEYGAQHHRGPALGAYHLPDREMWMITPHTPQAPTPPLPTYTPHHAHHPFSRGHQAPTYTTPRHHATQRVAYALATLITRMFGSARYPYPRRSPPGTRRSRRTSRAS